MQCTDICYGCKEAKEQKWNDALVYNTAGNIIESTIANVFIIKDKMVYTPALTDGCIAGVMRQYLITEMQAKGFTVAEQSLSQKDIAAADELFLTNAIRRIKWVEHLGDTIYTSKQTQSIYHSIFARDEKIIFYYNIDINRELCQRADRVRT